MKINPQTIAIYILLGFLTFGYTCTIRLGLGVFHVLYDPKNMGELPLVSKLTAQLSVIEIWQALAWISLGICMFWGIYRSKKAQLDEPHLKPWFCHLSWVLASFFGNVVGALAPFVSVVYVIP